MRRLNNFASNTRNWNLHLYGVCKQSIARKKATQKTAKKREKKRKEKKKEVNFARQTAKWSRTKRPIKRRVVEFWLWPDDGQGVRVYCLLPHANFLPHTLAQARGLLQLFVASFEQSSLTCKSIESSKMCQAKWNATASWNSKGPKKELKHRKAERRDRKRREGKARERQLKNAYNIWLACKRPKTANCFKPEKQTQEVAHVREKMRKARGGRREVWQANIRTCEMAKTLRTWHLAGSSPSPTLAGCR